MNKELKKAFWEGNKKLFLVAFITGLAINSINLYLSYVLQVVTDIAAGEEKSKSLTQVFIQCVCVFAVMEVIVIIFAKTQNAFKARAMRRYLVLFQLFY